MSHPPAPSASDTARDISQIVADEWESREAPKTDAPRENRFQVIVRQSVLNAIHRHGQSVQDIEICGVLVGNIYHDAAGPWAYIEHAIEGNKAQGRSTQVTFTAETWTDIQAKMDQDFSDKRILGWYHTHPGFGIFLSQMDVFIHQHFFPEPWQMAQVYDPKGREEGIFIWSQGKPKLDRFLIEQDVEAEQTTAIATVAREVTGPATGGADTAVLGERLDAVEKRQKLILLLLALVGLIALAWPLAVTTWLPDLLKRSAPPPPPANLPDYSDPTNRPSRLGM